MLQAISNVGVAFVRLRCVKHLAASPMPYLNPATPMGHPARQPLGQAG
jgi:hypothetical protein